MKLIAALPFGAALAGVLVVPTEAASDQAPLAGASSANHEDSSWWERLPSKDALTEASGDALDLLGSGLESILHSADDIQTEIRSNINAALAATASYRDDATGEPRHGPSSRDLTIYQLISLSNHTKKFARLVDEHPRVVKLLNSTETNYTLFVPIDDAFSRLPHGDDGLDEAAVEKALLYHVGIGEYPARHILGHHTLPTALDEGFLGGQPQRLRTSVGLAGLKINFYSKVVAADVPAKNGLIHAVQSILIPPTMVGRELSLFPTQFSTLLLAYEKTEFVKYIHGIKMVGSTVFAPSNDAFARLGPKANAFLFNTDKGLKYLRALLKYHISPNATLYTDAFYDNTHSQHSRIDTWESEHYDLPTLLDDTPVGVDVTHLAGFVSVKVNGFAHASVTDGVARNGVIHVVDKVIIPRCKHDNSEDSDSVDIGIEDLKKRLDPYMNDE